MDITKQRDLLVAWLKDAYSMERGLEETLKVYAKDAGEYPMVQDKIEEHIEVTRAQAERLKARLEAMGENTSKLKTLSGEIMGRLQGYGTKLANDKIIKNSLLAFASEYFEIGCYCAISAAAEKIGDDETVALAEQAIEEEQEMADWAEENLPELVHDFFEKEE